MSDPKYKMSMNLNVLNHLGINLYSNVPAVISEVVANSWDADAEEVRIDIGTDRIVILDNGCGMTANDINEKYLQVGYQKREIEGGETHRLNRTVMGRKGIGKLSLFSIANIIEVQSVKGKEKNGFLMDAREIEKKIKSGGALGSSVYNPSPLEDNKIILKTEGTRIELRELKKNVGQASKALKKRLARRFSIIGDKFKFSVIVDGKPITVADRDYFHKIQYIWYFGDASKDYVKECNPDKLKKDSKRSNTIQIGKETFTVSGWIGTVDNSKELKDGDDNLNKITVLSRGKLVQEDILEEFSEGGLYTKYIIGEVNADFLDTDDKEDIATSNRQEIKKEDPRYLALKTWILSQIKEIQKNWTDFRNETGEQKALEIAPIKEWYTSLTPDHKKEAKKLFGKINQLSLDNDDERKTLFKYSIIAFESFKYKNNLKALDNLQPEEIGVFGNLFSEYDDIEATLYYQIVSERLSVIGALQEKVENTAKEKILQTHIYKHLWLLDPHWERATDNAYMEQTVAKEFGSINAGLTPEEAAGRVDIKYKETSGKHIIIELKKADISIDHNDLAKQVLKYKKGLKKCLVTVGKGREPVEVICVLGMKCKNWTGPDDENEGRESLEKLGIRVVLYPQLIHNAYQVYAEFIKKHEESGRIHKFIQQIDEL
jgi:hypothetical protein